MSQVTSEPQVPGPRATWRIALCGTAVQLAFGLSFVWGAVAPAVRRSAHWSPFVVGAVFSAVPLGYGAGTAIGGRLAERVNPRTLCLGAIGLMGTGLTVALVVPTGATFVILYSGLGLGLGGGVALAGTLAAGAQVLGHRLGSLAGLLTAAYAGASVIEAPVATTLARRLGWLDALRLLGALDVAMAAVAVVALPVLQTPARVSAGTRLVPLREVVARRPVLLAAAIELLGTPVGAYALAHIALHAKGLGMTGLVVLLAVPIAALGNTLGRLGGGMASDRVGPDRLLLVILAAAAAAAILLAFTTSGAALLPASFVAGVGFGGPAGLVAPLARQAIPESPHAGFGLVFACFALGAFAGPLIGPAVGGGSTAWLVLAGMATAAFGLTVVRIAGAPAPPRRHC